MPVLQERIVDYLAQLPRGGYLIFPARIINTLHKYRQLNFSDTEAGGVLVGMRRQQLSSGQPSGPIHIQLTDCTEPQSSDKRTRTSIIRRSFHHRIKVLKAWRKSKMIETYMGEWHTHPQKCAYPSTEDFAQWKKNLSGTECILVVIGQEDDWIAWWDGGEAHQLSGLFESS